MSQYIACGTGSSKTTGNPCVLKRTSNGNWTKVHEQAVAGCFAFCGIHGLPYDSLIVAVGNMPHHNGGNPLGYYAAGAMSYYVGGSWHDVAVPSAFRARCVYVVNSDLVYIGGASGPNNATGKVWTWSPSDPTTFTEVLSITTTSAILVFPQVHSITGSGPSDIWASFGTGYDGLSGGSKRNDYFHFNGSTWVGPTRGGDGGSDTNMHFNSISSDSGFAAGTSMTTSDALWIGELSGGSWAWTNSGGTSTIVKSVAALANGTGLIAHMNGASATYISKYDGAVLSTVLAPTSSRYPMVRAFPNGDGFLALHTEYGAGATGWSVSTDEGDTWSAWEALVDGDLTAYYHALDCFISVDQTIQPTPTEQPPTGPYQLINNRNDYEIVNGGFLDRDKTIASRCRARLCTRRGQWIGDLSLGSRLHTIKILKNARELAMIYINEALQPMINAGEIKAINALEFIEDSITGSLGVSVEVVLPAGETVPLGVVAIGG